MIQISILPEYFEGFYGKLGRETGSYNSLIRSDGFILARFPTLDYDITLPRSGGVMEAHMDSTGGEMEMDMGHIEDPQLTLTVPYDVAKAILVDGNPQAGMQAFMSGQIQVTGDMTKLMAMQSGAVDPVQAEIAAKIKDITD